jgi:hypothetical protein
MRNQPLEKISWTKVESSNVEAIAFDDKTQTICVKFLNGGLYTYIGADQEIYMNFLHAPSFGKYLNNVVKAFPFTRWDTEKDLLAHLNI